MNGSTNDGFARRTAAGFSRRAAGRSLVAVLIAAGSLAAPTARARNTAKKKCKKQVAACEASVATFCARTEQSESEPCEAALLPCCVSLKACKAGEFYDCLIDALLSLEPPELR
jgi:hypothetical protein